MAMKTVFLSSTARDLSDYRKAVYHAIHGLDEFHCIRMEDFGARDAIPDEFCQQKVAECDLFVCLVGLCYGSIPPDSELSYTAQEYHTAMAADIPRLIFVSADDCFYPGFYRESDAQWQKQQEFRALINQERLRDTFTHPEELAGKVIKAISNWVRETQVITEPDYFEARATPAPEPHIQPFDHSICKSASLADLDLDGITEFFRRGLVQRQQDYQPEITDQDQMMRFGLLRESHPVYGALLCFGRNPQMWLSGSLTRCVYWHGDTREGGWQAEQEYRGDLLVQFDSSRAFLRKSLRFSRVIGREGRTEQCEIPFVALEEALANALVHREYANRWEPVQVEVFDNRVEIKSPGQLPPPMTLELLGKEDICHPRNPLIARIFYLYGHVEKVGSGIQRMQRAMEDSGLPPPEFELSDAQTFKVILYRPRQVPEEIIESEEFGALLSRGIKSIAMASGKTLAAVEEELSATMGLEACHLLGKWQQGIVPSRSDQIAALARACVQSGGMDQSWLQAFLKEARCSVLELLSLTAELFPGARPTSEMPRQLPRRAVHFQGREQELAALLEHLQPGAVVTLCGPGGIGKTALAAEALIRLPEDRFPDGIIFHTFYRQPEATPALEHIARSYGHEPRPNPADAARMALAGKRTLLVLDGAEEADDLGAVLACASGCGVLVTSRRRGDAPDPALRFDLGPLGENQAVALLQTLGGAWAKDEQAARAVCRLVGGLPLAVQLAGAYLARADEEVADYLIWLESTPLAALDFGQRQRESVPLLMARSLEQLSERARAALGLVGFIGFAPFGREVIAAGLGIEERAAGRVLGELVEYSLLTRRDSRYTVSHALVHTYARRHLSPGEEAGERLIAYYLALAQGTDDHTILNAERPHLLATMSDAHRRGDWKVTLSFAWALDNWLDLQGHWTDRVIVLGQALDAARGLGDRQNEGAVLGNVGNAYYSLGQVEQAIKCYGQALEIAREVGDRRGEESDLGNLGNAYAALGQVEQAIEYYSQALEIAREIGDRHGEGNHLGNLGNAYRNLGQVEQAIEYHQQALTIAREIGDRLGEGNHLGNLGLAYATLGQVEKAIEYYQQALEIACEIGDRRGEGNRLGNLGLAYATLGQVGQAIEYYSQALEIAREIGDRRGEGLDLGNLGLAYAALGQVEQAIEYYQQALEIACEIGDRRGEGNRLGNLGLAYAALGQVEQAIEYYQQALEIAREIGDRRGEGNRLGNLGNAYRNLGQVEQAIEYYQQALEIVREIGDWQGEGNVLGNLGNTYAALGDTARARQYLSQALAIFEEIKSPHAEQARGWLADLD